MNTCRYPSAKRRVGSAVLLVTPLVACDPIFATQYRQTLAPMPTSTCVGAALAASPAVATVGPLSGNEFGTDGPGFRVALRDSLAGPWPTTVTSRAMPDSTLRVTLTYTYLGIASPTATQRQRMALVARQLLATARAACAPASPDSVECHGAGVLGGQAGACRTAAR